MDERDLVTEGKPTGQERGGDTPAGVDGVRPETAEAATPEPSSGTPHAAVDEPPPDAPSEAPDGGGEPDAAGASEAPDAGGTSPGDDGERGEQDEGGADVDGAGEAGAEANPEGDGAAGGAPAAPMVVTPALRSVLAWTEITADEGEDDLEPFPVFEEEEPAGDEDLDGSPEDGADPEPVVAELDPAAATAAEEAPPAGESPPAEVAVVSAAGGGSGGTGGGGAGGGGATGADGKGRRRGSFLDMVDQPMTVFEHLDELRRRLMWAVVAFVAGTALTFAFIQQVLQFTLRAQHVHLYAIAPMEKLFAPIRLAAVGGVLIGSPVIVYQAVMYILPALTRRERKMVFSYLPATSFLFAAGLAFGYFVFEPVALRVATSYLSIVLPRYTLSNWVDFLIAYSLPFGLVFELPVVVVVLTRLGMLSPETLIKGRRFAIFGAVVVGEIFSPPADFIFTPSLIALPIIALYEISIQASRIAVRARGRDQEEEAEG